MIKVLVSGSRNHLNEYGVIKYLEQWISEQEDNKFSMIHGDCPDRLVSKNLVMGRSVDMIAAKTFKKYGKVQGFPADWSLGKPAGMIRNKKMVDMEPDVLLAFPFGASPGTRNCISLAKKANIKTILVLEEKDLEVDPNLPF